MDETVTGNIVRILCALGLTNKLGEAIKAEHETTLFVKIGQRYIDLKVWAIDGYLSNEDYEFWKDLPIVLGYYYDSLNLKHQFISGTVGSSTAPDSSIGAPHTPAMETRRAKNNKQTNEESLTSSRDKQAAKDAEMLERELEKMESIRESKGNDGQVLRKRGRPPKPVSALQEQVKQESNIKDEVPQKKQQPKRK